MALGLFLGCRKCFQYLVVSYWGMWCAGSTIPCFGADPYPWAVYRLKRGKVLCLMILVATVSSSIHRGSGKVHESTAWPIIQSSFSPTRTGPDWSTLFYCLSKNTFYLEMVFSIPSSCRVMEWVWTSAVVESSSFCSKFDSLFLDKFACSFSSFAQRRNQNRLSHSACTSVPGENSCQKICFTVSAPVGQSNRSRLLFFSVLKRFGIFKLNAGLNVEKYTLKLCVRQLMRKRGSMILMIIYEVAKSSHDRLFESSHLPICLQVIGCSPPLNIDMIRTQWVQKLTDYLCSFIS